MVYSCLVTSIYHSVTKHVGMSVLVSESLLHKMWVMSGKTFVRAV